MALFDLADVTRTIINLIEVALVDTNNWAVGSEPKVFADLPNRIKKDGLGFYLFHAQESQHFKNFPAPGKDLPPVGYIPMGLNLFYQLSANNTIDDGTGPLQEQLLMGIAMKTLHDNPQLTDTLPAGNKNRFTISLQTLAPNEAVQYWTAGESPVKLSAFYEVSVIFLEPKESTSYAGRVLSYANYIFVRGTPRITSSENIIQYLVPGDPVPRQVTIQPAQTPAASIGPAPIDSVVNLLGTEFGGGNLQLLVHNPRWPKPAVAGPAWELTLVADNRVSAIVRETAMLLDSPASVDIIPGLYAAQIVRTEQRTLPDGTIKEFRHSSNQFPFLVMPRIDTIADAGGGLFNITGYLFQHADLLPEDVQVFIGENRLTLVNAAVTASEFRVTGINSLELMLPAGLLPGLTAVRILVKGVESAPRWITIV